MTETTRPPSAARWSVGGRWAEVVLSAVFIYVSGRWFASYVASPGSLGFDARQYANAARAMLEGANPWRVDLYGSYFAGPPTTLVPFLPFAYLPEPIVGAFWIGLNAVLAAAVLRHLRMPVWWLAFPPVFYAIVLGSVEILMVALLILGGRAAGLSPLLKPYAVFPLLAERRWGAIALAAILGIASLVLLPWGTFVAELPWIADRLAFQASPLAGNAWGNPLLIAIAGIALFSFGIRRALWLLTPVLWPGALSHYAAMTLPAIPLVTALVWALPLPGVAVAGIIAGAIAERIWSGTRVTRLERRQSGSPSWPRRSRTTGGAAVLSSER